MWTLCNCHLLLMQRKQGIIIISGCKPTKKSLKTKIGGRHSTEVSVRASHPAGLGSSLGVSKILFLDVVEIYRPQCTAQCVDEEVHEKAA